MSRAIAQTRTKRETHGRIQGRKGQELRPAYDAWYKTYRWQKLRERHLSRNPLCVMCQAEGRVTLAKICDHTEAHRGDAAKFWDAGNLQSLCKPHHDSDKQRIEKGGKPKVRIALDGWPEE